MAAKLQVSVRKDIYVIIIRNSRVPNVLMRQSTNNDGFPFPIGPIYVCLLALCSYEKLYGAHKDFQVRIS